MGKDLEKVWRTATPANAVNLILASNKGTPPEKIGYNKRIVNAIDPNHRKRVLDFGAGVGRNAYPLAEICDEVWAFDFDNMINMLKNNPKFKDPNYNVKVSSNWAEVKLEKFSAIYAIIVLQHIKVEKVLDYLSDFTSMTDNLYVQSRSYSDDNHENMFELLSKYWQFDSSYLGYSSLDKCINAKNNEHYFIRLNPK